MKNITITEFSKMAEVSRQTIWRLVKKKEIKNIKKVGNKWLMSEKECLSWIEGRQKRPRITPTQIAKELNTSPSHVRKILSLDLPSFASRYNGRWLIIDNKDYRKWLYIKKENIKKKKELYLLSGRGTGILTYQGIITDFERWKSKIGGHGGILRWDLKYKDQFLKDTIIFSEIRKVLIENDDINTNYLSKSEEIFFHTLKFQKEG